MKFERFESGDLEGLPALQPPTWGDLVPRFRHFINTSTCFPIKISVNGRMAAIGASILHADTAWLACIVVHPEFRNRGLGTAITMKLMEDLDRQQYQTIYLDATEMGYPIYQKLGFVTETDYLHLRLDEGHPPAYPDTAIPFSESFREELMALDKLVSGEDRTITLHDHLPGARLMTGKGRLTGFYLPGLGDGLIVAEDPDSGLELMKSRLQTRNFAIFPRPNIVAADFLKGLGFVQYRTSRRMRLGKERAWRPECLYNRVSGQLG